VGAAVSMYQCINFFYYSLLLIQLPSSSAITECTQNALAFFSSEYKEISAKGRNLCIKQKLSLVGANTLTGATPVNST
jgi:hypothetical protein